MTPEESKALQEAALAPILHEYRLGIETLIFAFLAESGLGLNKFDIKTETMNGIIRTWVEPKVTM